MIQKSFVFYFLLILGTVFWTACGGKVEPETPPPTAGGQLIGSNGGTKTSNDSKASVSIPVGALSVETDITVEKAANPPSGNIGDAYEFGPDGIAFNQPVTIQISYDNANIPSGISASDLRLGKVVNDQWQTLPGSTVNVNSSVVSGTTNSFSVYGTIAALPGTPTGVFAVEADSQVTVSWNLVSGATSYNIYWNIAGGVTTFDNKIANVTSPYLHSALTNGTTYSYIVTAVNSVGEGSPSEEVSATPKTSATIPGSPQNIKAIPGDTQVTVSWNAVGGATSYNIYWNTIGGVTTSDNKISNENNGVCP